jgi:hypothetical protein
MQEERQGLAISPAQMEKMMQVAREQVEGDVPQYEIRQEEYPDGVEGGITPTLRNQVTQIIYSTHWEYQKRVLDHIESVISSDRQWAIVRKILMSIMTEQVERTRLLVSQRIRQETIQEKERTSENG